MEARKAQQSSEDVEGAQQISVAHSGYRGAQQSSEELGKIR